MKYKWKKSMRSLRLSLKNKSAGIYWKTAEESVLESEDYSMKEFVLIMYIFYQVLVCQMILNYGKLLWKTMLIMIKNEKWYFYKKDA